MHPTPMLYFSFLRFFEPSGALSELFSGWAQLTRCCRWLGRNARIHSVWAVRIVRMRVGFSNLLTEERASYFECTTFLS
jgi:hypothetical protein